MKWLVFESQWLVPHRPHWPQCEGTIPPEGFLPENLVYIGPADYIQGSSGHYVTNDQTSSIPSYGDASALLTRKDRWSSQLFLCITFLLTHTCPSDSLHILSFLWAQHYTSECTTATSTFKQTSNYPTSLLWCWASACCDHTQPYNNSTRWD